MISLLHFEMPPSCTYKHCCRSFSAEWHGSTVNLLFPVCFVVVLFSPTYLLFFFCVCTFFPFLLRCVFPVIFFGVLRFHLYLFHETVFPLKVMVHSRVYIGEIKKKEKNADQLCGARAVFLFTFVEPRKLLLIPFPSPCYQKERTEIQLAHIYIERKMGKGKRSFFFLFLQVLLIKKERLVSLRARKVSRKVIRNTHRVLLSLAYSSMSIVFFQKERRNVAALFSHLFLSLRVFPCVLGEWKKKKQRHFSMCAPEKRSTNACYPSAFNNK